MSFFDCCLQGAGLSGFERKEKAFKLIIISMQNALIVLGLDINDEKMYKFY